MFDHTTNADESDASPLSTTRLLARLGLGLAVVAATVVAGVGGLAAPAAAAPVASAPNETAAGPTGVVLGGEPLEHGSADPIDGDLTGVVRPAPTASEEGLQMEVVEVTEERIVVRVRTSNKIPWPSADEVYLGPTDQFLVYPPETSPELSVSLPEDTDGLATPVEMEDLASEENMHGKLMYFRTEDLDLSAEGGKVTLKIGVVDVPYRGVGSDTGTSKYWTGILGSIIVPDSPDGEWTVSGDRWTTLDPIKADT